MVDLPELGTPGEETVKKAKTLCPWLETPKECENCGAYCDAVVTWDPHMVEYTEAWRCPDGCETEYYREGY